MPLFRIPIVKSVVFGECWLQSALRSESLSIIFEVDQMVELSQVLIPDPWEK